MPTDLEHLLDHDSPWMHDLDPEDYSGCEPRLTRFTRADLQSRLEEFGSTLPPVKIPRPFAEQPTLCFSPILALGRGTGMLRHSDGHYFIGEAGTGPGKFHALRRALSRRGGGGPRGAIPDG